MQDTLDKLLHITARSQRLVDVNFEIYQRFPLAWKRWVLLTASATPHTGFGSYAGTTSGTTQNHSFATATGMGGVT